jgi:hypothetical protein
MRKQILALCTSDYREPVGRLHGIERFKQSVRHSFIVRKRQ